MHQKQIDFSFNSSLVGGLLFVTECKSTLAEVCKQFGHAGDLSIAPSIQSANSQCLQRFITRRIQFSQSTADHGESGSFRFAFCDEDTPRQQAFAKPCSKILSVGLQFQICRQGDGLPT